MLQPRFKDLSDLALGMKKESGSTTAKWQEDVSAAREVYERLSSDLERLDSLQAAEACAKTTAASSSGKAHAIVDGTAGGAGGGAGAGAGAGAGKDKDKEKGMGPRRASFSQVAGLLATKEQQGTAMVVVEYRELAVKLEADMAKCDGLIDAAQDSIAAFGANSVSSAKQELDRLLDLIRAAQQVLGVIVHEESVMEQVTTTRSLLEEWISKGEVRVAHSHPTLRQLY